MALDRDARRHLMATEGEDDHVITSALYCASCGYQLRMLPFVGRCPECGNDYIARGLNPKGIFQPQNAQFPFSDVVAAIVSAAFFCGLVGSLFDGFGLVGILFAGVFGYFSVVFVRKAWAGLRCFVRGQALASRINKQKESD